MIWNRWYYWIKRLHYWAGWGLGALALTWFTSGFFMTLKPIEEIRGNHLAAEPVFDLIASDFNLPDVDQARSITLIDALGTPAFIIRDASGREVVDARSGDPIRAFRKRISAGKSKTF